MKLCELPKKLTITVTAADIKKGERGSACDCPIALAVRRQLKAKRGEVVVTDNVVLSPRNLPWWASEPEICFELADEAKTFTDDFDAGKKVKPFLFVAQGLADDC